MQTSPCPKMALPLGKFVLQTQCMIGVHSSSMLTCEHTKWLIIFLGVLVWCQHIYVPNEMSLVIFLWSQRVIVRVEKYRYAV